MFSRLQYVILIICVSFSFAEAQTNSMPEYDLNKNYPGSQYKFSFVQLSDIHIGEGFGDYGTSGYFNDTIPVVDTSDPANDLRAAIRWINENKMNKNLKFVVISGDLTGSAEKSEFQMCKNLLNTLEIPYVPIIGNHDIWPYVRYQDEAPYACGDSVMNEIFDDVYTQNASFFSNWNDGSRLQRTYNPETQREHYLQNFSFEYDNFIFYGLDFNPRYHVNKAEPGIGPEAQLMDWNGGTFQWLKNELTNNPRKGNKNICFISHHPATDNILFILSGFVFDANEYIKMMDMLTPFKQHLGLWMAGHIHIDFNYPLVNNIMPVIGIAANKDFDSAHFRIVNVYEIPTATAIRTNVNSSKLRVFPNPSNGLFHVSGIALSNTATIQIFDVLGQSVYSKNRNEMNMQENEYSIDISMLPKGVYLLHVNDGASEYFQQLILH